MEDMAQNERQGLLPLYVCGANMSHEQESVDRPQDIRIVSSHSAVRAAESSQMRKDRHIK